MSKKVQLRTGQTLVIGSAAALVSLTALEGNPTVAYADKLAYGIPTVCGGHTDWKLQVGRDYGKDYCDKINGANLEKYGMAIVGCVKAEHLDQKRLDALTLFAVNVGIKGACVDSRAVKLINAGRYVEGCNAIATGTDGKPAWSNAGGKYVQGLQNRRQFEKRVCLEGLAKAADGEESQESLWARVKTWMRQAITGKA